MADITLNAVLGETSAKYWEKNVTDVNDVDEKFANARDLGYTRFNYSRLTAIGKLANNDSVDIYKTQVQSNGKLSISLRNASSDDDKVLNLSKYDAYLDELKRKNDPAGWMEEQQKKKEEEANQNPLELTAPGMRIEVYMKKGGRDVLVGDSAAEKGTKTREAMDQILSGEYRAKKGEYYIKVTRAEDADQKDDVAYALQIQMGNSYKHDYVAMEASSSDTKNKKTSIVPSTTDYASNTLSAVNALQIQATRYQATAQMLQVGYLNMASIYNKNSGY